MKKLLTARSSSRLKGFSCDRTGKQGRSHGRTSLKSAKSAVCRYSGDREWKGIKAEAYKTARGDWNRIIRKVLIGKNVKANSHVRYFEIAPGGSSSFEKHQHEHVVIGITGRGKVLLDKRAHKISYLDIVYISPDTPHQFLNPFDGSFGFLCIVPARRDKPILFTH